MTSTKTHTAAVRNFDRTFADRRVDNALASLDLSIAQLETEARRIVRTGTLAQADRAIAGIFALSTTATKRTASYAKVAAGVKAAGGLAEVKRVFTQLWQNRFSAAALASGGEDCKPRSMTLAGNVKLTISAVANLDAGGININVDLFAADGTTLAAITLVAVTGTGSKAQHAVYGQLVKAIKGTTPEGAAQIA